MLPSSSAFGKRVRSGYPSLTGPLSATSLVSREMACATWLRVATHRHQHRRAAARPTFLNSRATACLGSPLRRRAQALHTQIYDPLHFIMVLYINNYCMHSKIFAINYFYLNLRDRLLVLRVRVGRASRSRDRRHFCLFLLLYIRLALRRRSVRRLA